MNRCNIGKMLFLRRPEYRYLPHSQLFTPSNLSAWPSLPGTREVEVDILTSAPWLPWPEASSAAPVFKSLPSNVQWPTRPEARVPRAGGGTDIFPCPPL